MADVASADPIIIPTKRRTRKPLNPKNSSQNESDIDAGAISQPPLMSENSAGKENSESLSQHKSPKLKKSGRGKKQPQPDPTTFSFEKELQEMQEKLEKMTLEKQQAEEMLKLKEQELESHSREQEKVKMELKKLQKLKEFKPTMTLPILHSSKDKEQVKKKKKGCPETKKPATPYIMWCKEQWVKKEKPEAEFSEIANILGSKWKVLTPEEKKPYEEKYQIEKAAYSKIVGDEKRENEAMKLLEEEQKQKTAMELLEQYLQFKQEAEKEGGDNKKNKKERDPLKPKRPESAYFLFMNERRAALVAENKTAVEIAKITGEEWKNMTEKQKACYEKKAKKKNEKYNQEMEVYKQNKEEEAENSKKEEEEVLKILKQEALQLLKKKEKTETIIKKTKEEKNKLKEEKKNKKTDDPNKPKRPPSSFLLFSKQARKDLAKEKQGISNAQLTALISVKWKELSEEEKQKWNGEAAEAMEAYKKGMEEYNKNLVAEIPNKDN
ncbi:High mobility group (HMG) box domain-containing protein [Cynara cardunculus var. scolymus]|uniref:High mobility group (HMG) box domain-containing protein n=1 Tax=Cynara cardunculus var. scolymus TaxID=59895 RepID=A0A103XR88_CYNCS|nr:High mobility group (HMG) box domain-containing protein [Cynara cardunculus var. scolymus]